VVLLQKDKRIVGLYVLWTAWDIHNLESELTSSWRFAVWRRVCCGYGVGKMRLGNKKHYDFGTNTTRTCYMIQSNRESAMETIRLILQP
jgi:hypothetical protein